MATINLEIENIGAADATNALAEIALWNSEINALAAPTLQLEHNAVPGNGTITQSFEFEVPVELDVGSYHFRVEVGRLGNEAADDKQNNFTEYYEVAVGGTGGEGAPDLRVQNVRLDEATIEAGETTTIRFDVANYGNTDAPESRAGIYISDDAVFDPDEDDLIDTDDNPLVVSGDIRSQSEGLQNLANRQPGDYWLFVEADVNNDVFEGASEGNNVSSGVRLTIAPEGGFPEPDLVAENLVLGSTDWNVGDSISASWDILNIGSADARATQSTVYLSTDANVTTDDLAIVTDGGTGTMNPGEVNPEGDGSNGSDPYLVTDSLSPGIYYAAVIVDDKNTISESNERNNASNIVEVTVLGSVSPTVTTFVDGDGTPPDPNIDWHWWDERFGEGEAYAGDEFIYGGAGDDDFLASTGNDVIDGGEGYNQVSVAGDVADFAWSIDPTTGYLASSHETFGYDQYATRIDFWFDTGGWMSYDDVLSLTEPQEPTITTFVDGDGTPPDPNIDWHWWDERFGEGEAYAGDEFIYGGAGDDDFLASTGNDVIDGGEGYNQVSVAGDVADFAWSIDPTTGYLASSHETFGYDQYATRIDFWFDTGGWMSYDDVLSLTEPQEPTITTFVDGDGTPPDPNIDWHWWDERFGEGEAYAGDEFIYGGAGDDDFLASTGNDVIDGGEGYNQVSAIGDVADFTWSIDPTTGYLASSHETFGYDQYATRIDFWFDTGGWMSYDDVLSLTEPQEPTITTFVDGDGTPPDPNIDWHWWDERFGVGEAYAGDEFVFGGSGDDEIFASTGNDVIDGGEGYNQVSAIGDVADFTWSIDPTTGYLASSHDTFGYDQYATRIDFWFETGGWMSYDDVLSLT